MTQPGERQAGAGLLRDVTYLDNNATTRVDDAVIAAMAPYFSDYYGNPSSLHTFGAQVAAQIESARSSVARLIGARDSEIVFTSGGTEADNAALRGVLAARPNRRHVVLSAVEHHALIELGEAVEREGVAVSWVGVDRDGRLDLDGLSAALRDDTALVAVMLANNETGVVYPLKEVCALAHARGALVHSDAVNAAGKMAIDVEALGVDLLALSAHKVYGPKGVGALYIRRGTAFRPLQIGGPQERHRRGGTHNVPGIIGLGAACDLLVSHLERGQETARVEALRGALEAGLKERFVDSEIVGAGAPRLPNTTCVCFPGVEAEALLLLLSEARICASSGAACSSGSLEPSHVLKATGIPPEIAQGQIRFSLGRYNTEADVSRLLEVLPDLVAKVAAVKVP
jgi:cysteine desulfurase